MIYDHKKKATLEDWSKLLSPFHAYSGLWADLSFKTLKFRIYFYFIVWENNTYHFVWNGM